MAQVEQQWVPLEQHNGWVPLEAAAPALPSIEERRAASKAAFEANLPTISNAFNESLGLANKFIVPVGKAVLNTAPGATTGMESTGNRMLDLAHSAFAGAVPGAAATDGMGLVEGIKNSPAGEIASSTLDRVKKLFPSTETAGQKFQQVMGAAKDVPVDTTIAEEAAARAQELNQRGSSMPKIFRDFAKNRKAVTADFGGTPVTMQPGPMTYETGRDFASNAGALSATERMAANPQMQRQVAQFAIAMKDANREAAASVGMGDLYDAAMKEYRQAKNLQDAGEILKKWGIRATLTAAGLGAAYSLGSKLKEVLP